MYEINDALSTLNTAQVRLAVCWQETKSVWNDEVQRYFDAEFYTRLDTATLALWRAITSLGDTIETIYRTVE